MKSVYKMSEEITNKLTYISSLDRTKILVISSRIFDKPYTNHRLELNFYSIRYNAKEKTIFIYNKAEFDFDDSFDFDDYEATEIPVELSHRVETCDKIEFIISKIKKLFKK